MVWSRFTSKNFGEKKTGGQDLWNLLRKLFDVDGSVGGIIGTPRRSRGLPEVKNVRTSGHLGFSINLKRPRTCKIYF